MSMIKSKYRQNGMSLIEILVSVIVISIGLLGIAGMQAVGLKNNHSSQLKNTATFEIESMLDRMRADRNRSPSETSWDARLAKLLPGGTGSIACAVAACTQCTSICTVTVTWNDIQDDGSRGTRTHSISSQL